MTGPSHRCALCGADAPPGDVRLLVACARHGPRQRWNAAFRIRPLREDEGDLASRICTRMWGHDAPFCFGRRWPIREQRCLVADAGGAVAGLIAFRAEGSVGRILALAVPPLYQGLGAGGVLLAAAVRHLRARGAGTVELTTTNDNLPALRWYQGRGFRIVEVRPGAVARFLEERTGSVPAGIAGIPVRDEIRLALPPGAGRPPNPSQSP